MSKDVGFGVLVVFAYIWEVPELLRFILIAIFAFYAIRELIGPLRAVMSNVQRGSAGASVRVGPRG
jgi:hypothetical protein